MRTQTAITRAKCATFYFGLDLDKDFFTLEGEELAILERCFKASGYNGRNYLGRSRLRQFWYHLQWGWKKYRKSEKGAQ